MDAAVSKDIKFTERLSAQLRLEALNVFNHATFAIFAQDVNSPQFGQISSNATSPRQLQIALRVNQGASSCSAPYECPPAAREPLAGRGRERNGKCQG